MRKLLFIIAVLLSFGLNAQTFTPIHNYQAPDGIAPQKYSGIPHGDTATFAFPDSILIAGVKTKTPAFLFQESDSSLYVHWGYWIKVNNTSSGSGNIDSAYTDVITVPDSSVGKLTKPNGDEGIIKIIPVGGNGSGGGTSGGSLDTNYLKTIVYNKTSVDSGLALKLNISDTALMLSHYLLGVIAGTNITIDNTNPQKPIINSSGVTQSQLDDSMANIRAISGRFGIEDSLSIQNRKVDMQYNAFNLYNPSSFNLFLDTSRNSGFYDNGYRIHGLIENINNYSERMNRQSFAMSSLDTTIGIKITKETGVEVLTGPLTQRRKYALDEGNITAFDGIRNMYGYMTLNGDYDTVSNRINSVRTGSGGGVDNNYTGVATTNDSIRSEIYFHSFNEATDNTGGDNGIEIYSDNSSDNSTNLLNHVRIYSSRNENNNFSQIVTESNNDSSFVSLTTRNGTNELTLITPNPTSNYSLNDTKYVPISVNGNYSDSTGNITTQSPTISSGTSAPSSTPAKVGDIYVDTSNKKIYFATGTSSSSDWTIVN